MPDVFTISKRSEVMSRIRSHGNMATEFALIRIFQANGITGWRRKQRVFGKPDFTFPKIRLAVFVDGCFWHCCPKHGTIPKGNEVYWKRKFAANKKRDRLVSRILRQKGWTVARIWHHELRLKNHHRLLNRLRSINPLFSSENP